MGKGLGYCVAGGLLYLSVASAAAQPPMRPLPPGVARLFEDDAEGLLKQLTNPGDGPGEGHPDDKVVFSGARSLKITQYQRFHRRVPGWGFPIREKPGPDEYRYLRLAWKSGGAGCLMLQLHDALDWNIRYNAGPNALGWASRPVADKAPGHWSVMTIDLFGDFGERTLTGIAFTIHGGPGYFDHVYLGRTVEALDRVDANGLTGKKLRHTSDELSRMWEDLVADDAARGYRAYWSLAAGGDESAAFLRRKLAPGEPADLARVRGWIRQLDSESFAERSDAAASLRKAVETSAPLLEAELAASPSAEVRRRIEAILAGLPRGDQERRRREIARRVLRFIAERD